MTKQRILRAGDVLMFVICLMGGAWGIGAYGITARFWFDPVSVYVADSHQGEPITMVVERTIKRPFVGRYTATIRTLSGATVICEASGALSYTPDATMPDPVTMAWWAYSDPRCHGPNLPVGEYILTTTWTVENPFGVLPDKSVSITSNPFRILAQGVSPSVIMEQKTQIETLQRSVDELKTRIGE